jgi:hypothetical protein
MNIIPNNYVNLVKDLPTLIEVDFLLLAQNQKKKHSNFDDAQCWLCGGRKKIDHPLYADYYTNIYPILMQFSKAICNEIGCKHRLVHHYYVELERIYFETHTAHVNLMQGLGDEPEEAYKMSPELDCHICTLNSTFFQGLTPAWYCSQPNKSIDRLFKKYGKHKVFYQIFTYQNGLKEGLKELNEYIQMLRQENLEDQVIIEILYLSKEVYSKIEHPEYEMIIDIVLTLGCLINRLPDY